MSGGPGAAQGAGLEGRLQAWGGGRGAETPPLPAGISRWGTRKATSGASGRELLCWHPAGSRIGPGVAPLPFSGWGLLRTPGDPDAGAWGKRQVHNARWSLPHHGSQTWDAAKVNSGGLCPLRHFPHKLSGSPVALGAFFLFFS